MRLNLSLGVNTTNTPKTMLEIRDADAEKIGVEYTKLVNSHGSVEKNLDFNASMWGAKQGWDARDKLDNEALKVAVEALGFYSKYDSWGADLETMRHRLIKHDCDENYFGGKIAREALAKIKELTGEE